jgi:hypothetical protein
VRRSLENPFALLLRHTPKHRKLLTLGLQLLVILQAMEYLLFGFIADGAGVVKDQPSFLKGLNLAVALAHESPDHFLGIVDVHLAPERLDIESLFLRSVSGNLSH